MPLYTYRNEQTGEQIDLIQGMNDIHEYHGECGTEKGWVRVFYAPQATFDTKVDPNSPKAFVDYTATRKGTYGDMQDKAKELSEQRSEQNGGVDPVKEKFFKDYSDARKGAKHPEELKKTVKNDNFTVDWD
jgi:hypothetical protein